ncbi:FAD-dependent oxidoreductase, partial [bacterium]|nr:FAD-dependent oxidoreductase [candidate division CSSED10-310 bacterium]
GSDVLGVMDFLDRVKRGDPFSGYHRPVIIGGGNTAMDAARTAHFLTGHPATVIYRRTRQEMPAWQEEIDGCIEEGNRLIELTSPLRIERSVDRRVTGIVCESNCLGAPDRGGRPRPVPIPDSEHVIAADLVIVAIGQLPSSRSCSVPGLVISSEGAIRVSMDTMATDIPGVYAGGDSVHGPASIIQAVADGHRASRAIAAELGIELTTQINLFSNASPDWKRVHFSRSHLMHRIEPQAIPPDQRTRFDVILSGYTRDQAQQEAARCLQCDRVCDRCVDVCPNRANIPITIVPRFAAIPILKTHFSVPILHGFEPLTLYQDRQIIHIDDLCNACGNCATFCTYSGEPFKTKPVFFLDRNAFEADTGDAWHLTAVEMLRRVNGRLFSMTQEDGWFVVEFDGIRMTINQEFQVGELSGISVLTDDVSLIPVAEMIVYWEALANHPVAMMG